MKPLQYPQNVPCIKGLSVLNNLPKMLSFKGENGSKFYSCLLLSNVASLWKRLLLAVSGSVRIILTLRFIFRKPNCEKFWDFICLISSSIKFSSEHQEYFYVKIPSLLAHRMFDHHIAFCAYM